MNGFDSLLLGRPYSVLESVGQVLVQEIMERLPRRLAEHAHESRIVRRLTLNILPGAPTVAMLPVQHLSRDDRGRHAQGDQQAHHEGQDYPSARHLAGISAMPALSGYWSGLVTLDSSLLLNGEVGLGGREAVVLRGPHRVFEFPGVAQQIDSSSNSAQKRQ